MENLYTNTRHQDTVVKPRISTVTKMMGTTKLSIPLIIGKSGTLSTTRYISDWSDPFSLVFA